MESSDSQEEVPETPSLRTQVVLSGDTTDERYSIGCLECGDSTPSVAIIAVAVVEDQVLVVVPDEAWARKRADRVLPPGALRRPASLKVASCVLTSRTEPSPTPDLKVWAGFLDPKLESFANFDNEAAEIDFPGEADQVRVPYGPALVALCQDHFTFFSAGSQLSGGPPGLAPPVPMEQRLAALEEMMLDLRNHLVPQSVPVTQSLPATNPKPAPQRPPALRNAPSAPPGLPSNVDAAVAQQALQSGVSPAVLEEMAGIVGGQGLQVGKKKSANQTARFGEEDEDLESVAATLDFADGGAAAGGDPLQSAVVQLTKLVTHFSEEKVRKRDRNLETMLETAEGSGSAREAGSYSRSRAAALRTLQTTLKNDPKLIYTAVEKRLAEDWEESSLQPGIQRGFVSARGWLEHRSRVQGYPAAVRSGWALAGIWDALRAGRNCEARARAALALAQIDQQACDRGSFLLAAEVSLEPPPPMSSFHGHTVPEPGEVPHSRLLDPRWVDLMMSRLRDLSDYQERRIKLVNGKKTEEIDKPAPTGKPDKGKGKGKKGDTARADKSESSTPQA